MISYTGKITSINKIKPFHPLFISLSIFLFLRSRDEARGQLEILSKELSSADDGDDIYRLQHVYHGQRFLIEKWGSIHVHFGLNTMSILDEEDLAGFAPEPVYAFAAIDMYFATGIIFFGTDNSSSNTRNVYFLDDEDSDLVKLTGSIKEFFTGKRTYSLPRLT